jgi:hypothetical protein
MVSPMLMTVVVSRKKETQLKDLAETFINM